MTPSSEPTPAVSTPGPLATLLRAVRSGSVGVSRVIWRVLSTIHEQPDTGTRTAATRPTHPGAEPARPGKS